MLVRRRSKRSATSAQASSDGFEATSDKQRSPRFGPPFGTKLANERANTRTLSQADVIKVGCAGHRHTIVRREHDLRGEPTDRSGQRRRDDLAELLDDSISSEEENGPAFVSRPKRVPPDLT